MPRDTEDVDFNLFWEVYPRKTAKQVALKAWLKLKPEPALVARIITAVGRQKESDQWKRGIICHPSTWLNQHRWEDEMACASPLTPEGTETARNLNSWLASYGKKI